jgi:hypothetical protein
VAVTPKQHQFVALVGAYMAGGQAKPLETFMYGLKADELQDCLQVFIDKLSKKYGIEKKSMDVFFAFSLRTLAMSEPFFALKYEWVVRPEAKSQWSERFAFLRPDQSSKLNDTIAEKKRKASYLDFRRFELFKESEADIETERKAKPPPAGKSGTKKQFLDLFHAHMTARSKKATHELSEFIYRLMPDQLEEFLALYLEESQRYAPSDEFSLYAFFALSSRALRRCPSYFAYKFELLTRPQENSVWSKRYAALNQQQLGDLESELRLAKKRARVLDDLRFAYFQLHRKDADARALRDFEPASDPELSRTLSGLLAACDRDVEAMRIPAFLKDWDELAALYEEKDTLRLLMLLKHAREWLRIDKEMRDELYWFGVGALLIHMLLKRPEIYKDGFSDEELRFFLPSDASRHHYYGDFGNRLRYLVRTRNYKNFTGISKAQAGIELYAMKRNMTLATMADTKRVYDLAKRLREEGPKDGNIVQVRVRQPQNVLHDNDARVSIGETFGDLTIVWFDNPNKAYVESRNLEKVLFILYETDYVNQLGRLSQDRFYDVLWENTQHLLEVIPFFFDILTYIPDLVSGGLTGLAKSIAEDWIFGKLFENAPEVGMVAQLAWGHVSDKIGIVNSASKDLRGTHMMDNAATLPKGVNARELDAKSIELAPKRSSDVRTAVSDIEVKPTFHAPEIHAADRPSAAAFEDVGGAAVKTPPKVDKLELEEKLQAREMVAASAGGGKTTSTKKKSGGFDEDSGAKGAPSARQVDEDAKGASKDKRDTGTGDKGTIDNGAGSVDPLVVAKIQGPSKGQYWTEGTTQFQKAAGTPSKPPDAQYVVLPKSQAETLGFRPAGTPPRTTIEPTFINGKQVESLGAGRPTAGPDPPKRPRSTPKPGHPVRARATRTGQKGGPKLKADETGLGTDIQPKSVEEEIFESANEQFGKTIGADVRQAAGYKRLLESGELGILRPGNISTGGVDSITVRVEGGKATIFLNDHTVPGQSKGRKPSHEDWGSELDVALGRLDLGDRELEKLIREAAVNDVWVRPVRTTIPAEATDKILDPIVQLGRPQRLRPSGQP